MPRPGPRPYECVRRAWHSDRHQPIRGSLIQEIFRLANEVHNPTTRKNKEWLEKLPLVVLKAEEIMYSKANSEAEYMDLKTLWDRANDAIDTIIRKDDSPETEGDMLQPCIEAALNLGCVPRRASRSQRHNNPESYLSSINKETPHLSTSMHLLCSSFVSADKLNHFNNEVHSIVPNGSFEPKNLVGTYNCPSLGHVYPLHYSDTQLSFSSTGVNCLRDFIGSNNANGALNKNSIFEEGIEKTPNSECNLSLRLGISQPNSDKETAWTWTNDVGSSSSSNGY